MSFFVGNKIAVIAKSAPLDSTHLELSNNIKSGPQFQKSIYFGFY
jgi:hypothetical protein